MSDVCVWVCVCVRGVKEKKRRWSDLFSYLVVAVVVYWFPMEMGRHRIGRLILERSTSSGQRRQWLL